MYLYSFLFIYLLHFCMISLAVIMYSVFILLKGILVKVSLVSVFISEVWVRIRSKVIFSSSRTSIFLMQFIFIS